MDFTAVAELADSLDTLGADEKDSLSSSVAPFRGRVNRSLLGRARVVITIAADDLTQAVSLASIVLRDAADGRELVSLAVRSSHDYAAVGGVPPTDGWSSVSEVATERGISRQAVLQQIASGSLAAAKVGTTWVVPRGPRRSENDW